jgi:hypothetical protein
MRGRDNSVGMVYGPDGRGSIPGKGESIFCSPQRLDRLSGPVGTGGSFPGAKVTGALR